MKRIYEPAEKTDGKRYLVERLWPRGISKEKAALTAWLKEVAPSAELRVWFGHDPAKWPEFRRRYFMELDGSAGAVSFLRDEMMKAPITLVYAAREDELSCARALKEYLEGASRS